ncbi:MAG: hypothetical protein FK733_05810 [Asgard group archaeon]|nr:hypothetical protein [Asgard group archaeon]
MIKGKMQNKPLVLVVILTLVIGLIPNTDFIKANEKEDPDELILIIQAEWDLTGTPIDIDDTDITKDWTWAVSQTWCSGGGTAGNPYRLENITIDGLDSSACISIRQSTAYFVIENCVLYNSGDAADEAGIYLAFADNGIIRDSNISYNNGHGIDVADGDNIQIINNTLHDNGGISNNGMLVMRLTDSLIYNNTITDSYFGISSSENNLVTYSTNIIYGHQWGISCAYDSDCTIYNNEIYDNTLEGIVLEESDDNKVELNEVYLNSRIGIWSFNGDNNDYFENSIYDNTEHGLMIVDCDSNNLTGNDIYDNDKNGLLLLGDINCYNNTIKGNTIYNNKENGLQLHGLTMEPMGKCESSIVIDNTVYENDKYGIAVINSSFNKIIENIIYDNPIGLKLNASNANNITKNTIYDNDNYGVLIDHPYYPNEYNIFTENNFNNPLGLNAEDNGNNNLWDDGNIGNFWHNYGGVDNNDDGIGDTPHNIPGSALSVDNKPIFWDAPIVDIIDPTTGEAFATNAPNFEISLVGNIDQRWYRLDDGIISQVNTTFSGLTGIIEFNRWDELNDGTITLEFFANDTNGNVGSASVSIVKDTTDPVLSIVSPIFGSVYSDPPSYEITITEINLDEIWYSLDDGSITTDDTIIAVTTGTISQTDWDLVGQGIITITFYANDLAMNEGFIQTSIEKDSVGPNITIIQPVESQSFGKSAPNYELTLNDIADTIWYTLNNGETKTYTTTLTGVIDQDLWKELEAGNVKITFFANDSLGNIGSAYINVTKEKSNLALIVSLAVTIPVLIGIGITVTIFIIRGRKAASPG